MRVTRGTFDDDTDGYVVEDNGETYRFETVGSGTVRLVDDLQLPPDVAKTVMNLGAVSSIEISECFHVRDNDPDDPHVGLSWYRVDSGVFRTASFDGSIEKRAVWDVPSSKVYEDFEGKSASDFNLGVFEQGSPDYSVVERDGSDQFETAVNDGDVGQSRMNVEEVDGVTVFDITAEVELTTGSIDGGIGTDSYQNAEAAVFLESSNTQIALVHNGSTKVTQDTNAGELVGVNTVTLTADSDTGDIEATVETAGGNTYSLSHSEAGVSIADVFTNAFGNGGSGSVVFDDIRAVEDLGELSPEVVTLDELPQIPTKKLEDSVVTTAKLDADAVTSEKIPAGAVGSSEVDFVSPLTDDGSGKLDVAVGDGGIGIDEEGKLEVNPGNIVHDNLGEVNASSHHSRPSAGEGIVDNSDTFEIENRTPEDLSARNGRYDGERALDDGTNTPARCTLCVWDGLNITWRPQNDPSGGAF